MIPAFRSRSPNRALTRAGDGLAPFSPAWCDAHLPLIDAAMDLFGADDAEFARRCAMMVDEMAAIAAMIVECRGCRRLNVSRVRHHCRGAV